MAVRTEISEHERFRRQLGLSVTGVAERVPCSHAYVSRIEGGLIPASARYRKAVAKLFGVSEALLFDEDGWRR